MQQATQIQTTSLEITTISNETKKPNRLVGFLKGVKDKFEGVKDKAQQLKTPKDENIKTGQTEKTKDESGEFFGQKKRKDGMGGVCKC